MAPAYQAGCTVEMQNARSYGDGAVSFSSLSSAVAFIGNAQYRLYLGRGTWPVTSNLTLPNNLTLSMEKGAILNVVNGVTLTIQGPVEAGPQVRFFMDRDRQHRHVKQSHRQGSPGMVECHS